MAALLVASPWGAAQAGCSDDGARGGLLGLDRCEEFEATGLYSRSNQKRLDALVLLGTVGVALWDGTGTRRGGVAWQALDSMAMAAVTTEVIKNLAQRPRPSQAADPDLWRQGSGHKSFPSGEAAMMAAFVTPIIRNYQSDTPAVWALAALPVYMGAARMGSQAHWLSDVLVGSAVGTLSGYLASERDSPWLLVPFKGGGFVGLHTRF
jgi:membrane-associated phospholipid phosphatase